MKTNIFLWLLLGVLSISCLDDKTNYDYKRLNEISKIENIESSYTIYPGDELTLEPVLKFTLDSIHPSVGYEWYVDLEKVSEEPIFTYKAEEVGSYYVTLVVTENSSKVQATQRTIVKVDSEWKKGWLILSDRNNTSELSLLKTQLSELRDEDGYFERDTLLIMGMDRNISPNLGTGPKKLFEHLAFDDYKTIAHDIVVLQDDKCVELNGYTLEREVYTEEEFIGHVPAGFNPVDVAMSYKSNVVLNQDGLLYYGLSYNAEAFHTVRYSSEPYAQGKKFSNIAVGKGGKASLIMAVMEHGDGTRSFVGIVDDGRSTTESNGDFTGTAHRYNGALATLPDGDGSEKFNRLTAEVLLNTWNGEDPDYGDPMFLALLRENGACYFLNYQFEAKRKNNADGTYSFPLEIYYADRYDVPADIFDNYTDIAVFPWRDYVIVASGTTLHLVNYIEGTSTPLALERPLAAPITTLGVRDFDDYYEEYEGPQLGVGLENGEFFVFEVNAGAANLREVYHADGLGVIKDVIYKYCNWGKYAEGKYY